MQTIARRFPAEFERLQRMLEKNFQSEFFVPASVVDREIDRRIEDLLHPKILIPPTLGPPSQSPCDT
jgi:hypothetical protein